MQFLTLAALLGTALAAIAPADDPFYIPPAGFESTAPGTILANRTFIPSFLGLIPDPVLGYQLLYRTTAINGSAIAGVTSIFVPGGASKDKFVSFQTAYDSSASICDPSYNYQLLAAQTDLISSVEMLLIQGFLLGGYVVSAPDYEGPEAAFGAGRLSGTGVLDSMRAVSNFHSELEFNTTSPAIVGVGYSGGAIATGWAASLASSYAPELPVKGWSMGGTPANLTGTAEYINETPTSGFLPAAIAGLNKQTAYYALLNPTIQSVITPYGTSLLEFADENCAVPDLGNFYEGDIFSTKVQSLGDRLFYDPAIRAVMLNQTMGYYASEYPKAPVYLYHAVKDEIIPYANASTLDATWCNDGAKILFTTYENGGHFSTEILGYGGAYKFVGSAFAGTASQSCAQVSTLGNPLNPIAEIANLEPLLVDLLEALRITGTEDQNVQNNATAVLSKTIPTSNTTATSNGS